MVDLDVKLQHELLVDTLLKLYLRSSFDYLPVAERCVRETLLY